LWELIAPDRRAISNPDCRVVNLTKLTVNSASQEKGVAMNVIEPFIEEHHIIKKTLDVFDTEIEKIKEQQWVDPVSINLSIDFIRTYTDLVHHGKEENILFRELGKKDLSKEHSELMNELMVEHKYSRSIVGKWINATERYFNGEDTAKEIIDCLQELAIFYPQHIAKEDQQFFGPILEYFAQEEQNKMLREFQEFDNKILHWKYRKVESVMEEKLANMRPGNCPGK
jgi:hemerythrin-like domain-containing protein